MWRDVVEAVCIALNTEIETPGSGYTRLPHITRLAVLHAQRRVANVLHQQQGLFLNARRISGGALW
jgi:hypothetical protein